MEDRRPFLPETGEVVMNKKRQIEEATNSNSIRVIPWSDLRLFSEISGGSGDVVYEAELIPENRKVAVRRLFTADEIDEGEEEDETFCREARLMVRLHHPNILSFHGVAYDATRDVYQRFRNLVLDCMPSDNLAHAVEDGDFVWLPWRIRVIIAAQIASTMEYIHSMNLIYFDLKSANVLLDFTDLYQPSCKIYNFSMAKEKRDDMSFMHYTGAFCCTAPEVSYEKAISEKFDVYSFGLVMYELLNRREAPDTFVCASDEMLECTFLKDLGRHTCVPEWCYHRWRGLMRDCLASEPDERPAFTEVAARLSDMLVGLPEIKVPLIKDLEPTLAAVKKFVLRFLAINGKRREAKVSIRIFPWSDLHERRVIARCGEAVLYEAELKPENRIVAVRQQLYYNYDQDEDERETFCSEARRMAQLDHPNIISFLGVAAHSDQVKPHDLVLEYMPDGDLADTIKEDKDFARLSWKARVLIASQIALAMEYLHSLGLIHFDLKPANVLLDFTDPTNPSCKICDFGCAREKQDDMSFMHEKGTLGYMAPEVYFEEIPGKVDIYSFGLTITEKVDIYSFGIIMYELVSRREGPGVCCMSDEHMESYYLKDIECHNSVPEWCYRQWMGLIRDCVVCESTKRPAFTEIVARLHDMLVLLS